MSAMRAACYARYSSDLQRATSIEDQVATARRYAEQQGWTVVPACIYTDAAVSGASIQGRRGIQALLAAAAVCRIRSGFSRMNLMSSIRHPANQRSCNGVPPSKKPRDA